MRRIILIAILICFALGNSIVPCASQTSPAPTSMLAVATTKSVGSNQVSSKSPREWSRRKKVITALTVAAAIGASIAIPVTLGVCRHHQQVVRMRRLRRQGEAIISQEEAVVRQEEDGINSLLSRGPTLAAAQRGALQAALGQLQQEQAVLSNAFTRVASARSVAVLKQGETEALQAAMDFGLLPPEINSARIFSGPGSGPLLQAAGSWQTLSEELLLNILH